MTEKEMMKQMQDLLGIRKKPSEKEAAAIALADSVDELAEMFCDRLAASKIYQGKNYLTSHPLEYFERGNAKKIMHPETAEKLKEFLIILNEKGEVEAFKAVRKFVKDGTY